MKRTVGVDYIIVFFLILILIGFASVNLSFENEYTITVFLPISYLIGFIIWGIFSNKRAVLLQKIIMLLMFIKICLFPSLVLINGGMDISRYNKSIFSYLSDAVIIQIIEYGSILICLIGFKWPYKTLREVPIVRSKNKNDNLLSKKTWSILCLCLLIVGISIVVQPSFLNRFRPIFFINKEMEINWKKISEVALNTLPPYIYYPINWLLLESRLILAYMIVVKIKKSKIQINDQVKVILSCIAIVCVLVLIVPDDVATSIYAAITLFLLLYVIYPSKRSGISKMLMMVCSIVVSLSFFIMPIISGKGVSLNYITAKLNAYFSGYINISACVAMNAQTSDRLSMFIGDFFRSLPVVKGYFSSFSMSNELFNYVLGYDIIYNSQIIPLEGQGYYYLWYVGVILFTITHMCILKNYYCKMIYSYSSFSFYINGVLMLLMTFGLVMYGFFLNFSLVLAQLPLILINCFFVRRKTDESPDIS